MRCKILHECKCRIRLHAMVNRMSLEEADQLENYLNASPVIQHAKVYERTCDMVIQYDGSREEVVKVIAAFQFDREALVESTPENSGRALGRYYQERILRMVGLRAFNRIFLPAIARNALTV